MNEITLYKLIKKYKSLLTKQQYLTIKGQIKKNELLAAYKGIIKCLNNNLERRKNNEI